ncbi:aldose 1-epimerase family protein [Acidisphaera sp. L21]|uniref:aldose 1-epimerase family protein n=1 Tax=Acidisphaera sp. L21 TaxID=1641851 RepID=UPI00131AE397|nr:aldose 1-epimerase family protein [Acidisphaera sp. L21]
MTDDATDYHEIASGGITARIKADGAELSLLRDATGLDYLWPATAPWPRHAPVLFPIVGRLRDDTLTHRGRDYRMTQHGFARDRRFTWVERTPDGCALALSDDAETRAIYPFGFRFEVRYAVEGSTLAITYTATNTGDEVLPASMGAHPAFRWPLTPGVAKEDYALHFDAAEAGPMWGVEGGLLTEANRPCPIAGQDLRLRVDLFAADALILPKPASRSVRYAAATGPALTVAWEGFQQLGIWSRADADFLCIEPWKGMASPADFDGEFVDKPWLMLIPPGESRSAIHRMTVQPG